MSVLSSCAVSFLVVFILLGVLAALIKLVDALFPEADLRDDGPVIAAIHTVVSAQFPEAQVTGIKEVQS